MSNLFAALFLLLALTRAEIVERFKAPIVTQSGGLVQVHADCPEDMRREFQLPIASFAAETVKTLYSGTGRRPGRFSRPGIVIHVGDIRTNLTEVTTTVSTNGSRVVTRIYVKSPGFADLAQLRTAVVRGFCRSVENRELTEDEAAAFYRHADPALRIADERRRLEEWLTGRGSVKDDEEGLKLMRKIIEPGKASRRDVLTFASRLYLYPPTYDRRFAGRFDCLSFREALEFAKIDPRIRLVAAFRSREMTVLGGGRGDAMTAAAEAYRVFLSELGKQEKGEEELKSLLDEADEKLNIAFEKAK